MRAERLNRKFGHSKSLAFCILVGKFNQYKKGSLRFGREAKFLASQPRTTHSQTVVFHTDQPHILALSVFADTQFQC